MVSSVDVSHCQNLTKAEISACVEICGSLTSLHASNVGPGSWSTSQIERLLSNAPDTLREIYLDCRVELKNDLDLDSQLLRALESASVAVEKIVLVADNVASAVPAPADGAAITTEVAMDAVTAAISDALVIETQHAHDAVAGVDPSARTHPQHAERLRRLSSALSRQLCHLTELDASSGSLGVAGGVDLLLAPLLRSPHSALCVLRVASLPRGSAANLASSIACRDTLQSVDLRCNMFSPADAALLAAALEGHPGLTSVNLDQNPMLDDGCAAIASALPASRITSLSMAFTGVADRTCEALSAALRDGCRLTSLNLTGNLILPAGAASLADGLRRLHDLNLSANLKLASEGASVIARALPGSQMRRLSLSGCTLDKKACSRLAAALPACGLRSLDVSSNHFEDEGCWELAWALKDCPQLHELNLADCMLTDDAADEVNDALSEVLAAAGELHTVDLRYNRLSAGHAVGKDPRVDARGQKGASAAEAKRMQIEGQAAKAKASGKKLHVPKWVRKAKEAEVQHNGPSGAG